MRLYFLALAILVGFVAKAQAHTAASGWTYDAACCSDRDCGVARIGHVVPTAEGWRIQLKPGDHHFFEGGLDMIVPYGDRRLRESQDTEFHICLGRTGRLFCLYIPHMGG